MPKSLGSEPIFRIGGDDNVGGGGSNGDSFGRGDGGDGEEGDDHEEQEFGAIMKFEEVMREAEARGVKLPSDLVGAAETTGIRKMFLLRYLDLQVIVYSVLCFGALFGC